MKKYPIKRSTLRLLLADDEFLVALDMERIARERLGCEAVIVRPDQIEISLTDTAFNVVVLDGDLPESEVVRHAATIAAAGARMVLSTTDGDADTAADGFPAILKPFSDEDFAAMIHFAATRAVH